MAILTLKITKIMEEEIINILKKHGCLYMKDDYIELLMDIQNHYKEAQSLQFRQSQVMRQRELLFAYEKHRTNHIVNATDEWRYANVDLFLSKQ